MIRTHQLKEEQVEKETENHPWKLLASFHCKDQGYYKSLSANIGGRYKVEIETIPGVDEPHPRYEGRDPRTAIWLYNTS